MMRVLNLSFCILAVFAMIGCASSNADAPAAFKYDFDHHDGRLWYISDGWANGDWQACEWRATALSINSDKKLQITLSDKGGKQRPIGCGEIRTKQVYGYGLYETRMRAAEGAGLNSAFFTYIGPANHQPWDEIDFEFLGKNPHAVETNFYTNGKSMGGTVVNLDYDATKEFHNYAIKWEPTKITWYVDGKLVHESPAGVAIPSHPSSLFFSLWAGGAQENNWMGEFKYTTPKTAEIEWAAYTPLNERCKFPQSMTCK
jgi:endo-1,3-1,4-beta-glycanase ExoK